MRSIQAVGAGARDQDGLLRLPDEFPGASLKVSMGFTSVERDGAAVVAPTEADAEECAKRKAVSASIAAGKLANAEKQLTALRPLIQGACPEELGIQALRDRLERAREAKRAADERERRQADQRSPDGGKKRRAVEGCVEEVKRAN